MVAIKMFVAVFSKLLVLYFCVVNVGDAEANPYRSHHQQHQHHYDRERDGHHHRNREHMLTTYDTKMDYINRKWKDRSSGDFSNLRSPAGGVGGGVLDGVRVRHSRHPNLDKVLSKIDSMQVRTSTGKPAGLRNYWRSMVTTSTTTTSDGLFGDYDDGDVDDLDYDDDWTDDIDDKNDDDNYDEDIFSDDFDDGDDDGSWQAEEATEKPEVQSKLTELKWRHYGTRDRVEESRRNQLNLRTNNNHEAAKAVVQHALRVDEEGRCRRPTPKVISVQSEYPDPSKTYIPHCTILHRCAEDTGCCSNYATKCAPKKQVKVQLYFYTNTIGSARNSKVEKLEFYNHTECACLEVSQVSPKTLTEDDDGVFPEENARGGVRVRAAPHTDYLKPPGSIRRCKCPEVYSTVLKYNNKCGCDCTDGKQDCIRMKKGKEYFSLTDRKCILSNECGPPTCEYGPYLRHKGRCPKKEEKLEAFGKMNVNK